MIKDNFSTGDPERYIPVFKQHIVPVFQNKVYPDHEKAVGAQSGEVALVQSAVSGFIFNKAFDPSIMNYDIHYQNEQSNSSVFQEHLQDVLNLLKKLGIADKKIIEIGCGKGIFFEKMLEEGFNCLGFDPTYEGNNERIKKEYFNETHKGINADVILMRHTLEHITQPFSFLHTIAKANNHKGYLFVEVPTFDWIANKNAFWDIFYEHCNYFNEQSLSAMFDECETGNLFGGQYIYLWADLSKLRNTIPENVRFTKRSSLTFEDKLKEYKDLLQNSKSIAIWGAGAKGSTFLNLLDKDKELIKYVLDINPAKQNKFVGGTGHPIYDPSVLLKDPVDTILVMNENYIEEIKTRISTLGTSSKLINI